MDGKFTFVDHRVINLMGYTPVIIIIITMMIIIDDHCVINLMGYTPVNIIIIIMMMINLFG